MSLQQDGSYRAAVDSGHEGGSVNNISPISSTGIDHYLSIQPQTALPDETASVLAHNHSTTKRNGMCPIVQNEKTANVVQCR